MGSHSWRLWEHVAPYNTNTGTWSLLCERENTSHAERDSQAFGAITSSFRSFLKDAAGFCHSHVPVKHRRDSHSCDPCPHPHGLLLLNPLDELHGGRRCRWVVGPPRTGQFLLTDQASSGRRRASQITSDAGASAEGTSYTPEVGPLQRPRIFRTKTELPSAWNQFLIHPFIDLFIQPDGR